MNTVKPVLLEEYGTKEQQCSSLYLAGQPYPYQSWRLFTAVGCDQVCYEFIFSMLPEKVIDAALK